MKESFYIKIAGLMLKFISKICTRYKGLNVVKYSKLNGTVNYYLEFHDCPTDDEVNT